MTFSEFGRRIKSNGSAGTDHGAAQPVFLFGEPVKQGVLGNPPDLPSTLNASSSLPMQYDFRSVYATVLRDWFCVDPNDVSTMLYKNYQYLPLMETTACKMPEINTLGDKLIRNDPNPFIGSTTITFKTDGGYTLVQIFDVSGKLVGVPVSANYQKGEYTGVLWRFFVYRCLLCPFTKRFRTTGQNHDKSISLTRNLKYYLLTVIGTCLLFFSGIAQKDSITYNSTCVNYKIAFDASLFDRISFPDKVIWNFGDPASGFYNSAGVKKPSHLYAAPGNYPVSLLVVNAGDTIRLVGYHPGDHTGCIQFWSGYLSL